MSHQKQLTLEFTETSSAQNWLTNIDAIEQQLASSSTLSPDKPAVPIKWNAVANQVYLPHWHTQVQSLRLAYQGLPLNELPNVIREQAPRLVQLSQQHLHTFVPDRLIAYAGSELIAALLIVVLSDRGWTLEAVPGKYAVLRRGDQTISPFDLALEWFVSGGDVANPWMHQLHISDSKE